MRSRIMYIELKTDGLAGPSRIGRVTYSKSGKTIFYRDKTLQLCKGRGFKCNYFDRDTNDAYWISGCKRYGRDRLYPGTTIIDDDVREEYWMTIRKQPERKHLKRVRCTGKYGGKKD